MLDRTKKLLIGAPSKTSTTELLSITVISVPSSIELTSSRCDQKTQKCYSSLEYRKLMQRITQCVIEQRTSAVWRMGWIHGNVSGKCGNTLSVVTTCKTADRKGRTRTAKITEKLKLGNLVRSIRQEWNKQSLESF